MNMTTIKQMPAGELFKRARKATQGIDQDGHPVTTTEPMAAVWVRGEYDRREKAFWCYQWDNYNCGRYIKGSTQAFVGFTF